MVTAGCGAQDDAEDGSSGAAESGIVARVVDGDTLHLADGRRIRLVQIDAPEVAECYAGRATDALERAAPAGTQVELDRDPGLDDVDEHGRLLRYVLVDNTNVNVLLVRLGAAAPYFFRAARGRFADELVAAAEEARDDARGFWGACADARLDPERGSRTGSA